MSVAGSITRAEISQLTNNLRIIKWLESIQSIVFSGLLTDVGNQEASVASATLSIPITLPDGTVIYLKASTTP